MVGRAVSDLHLDRAERKELQAFATDLQLTNAQIVQAHRRYVNELIDTAIEDQIVTDDEYDTLVRVAAALDVDVRDVDARIAAFRIEESLTVLRQGMQVVFTGEHPNYDRDDLHQHAASIGLIPTNAVSKTTDFVSAVETDSSSGKATKARRYGIPVITVDEFIRASIGDVLAGYGAGQTGLKIITCRDCLVNWTAPATSTASTTRRCETCAAIAASTARSATRHRPAQPVSSDPWAPPIIEWLTCRTCTSAWHRQVSKGRKPHHCPKCSNTPPIPAPPVPRKQPTTSVNS